jgi:hypothetical protein
VGRGTHRLIDANALLGGHHPPPHRSALDLEEAAPPGYTWRPRETAGGAPNRCTFSC